MASHALTLYTSSNSTYDLEGVSPSIDLVPESTFVREEARIVTEASLAIMPPPSYTMSGGLSLKTTARSKAPQGGAKEKMVPTQPTTGTLGLKQKALDVSGPRKHSVVMPTGNMVSHASSSFQTARPSLSYTVVGVRKPEGGYGKALMRKPAKKLNSKMASSGKESESSGAPLKIKRMIKPQIRGQPAGFFSESEDKQPSKGPMLTSLRTSNRSLRESIRKANDRIAESILKIKELIDEINELGDKSHRSRART
jgi:hypothetical protein